MKKQTKRKKKLQIDRNWTEQGKTHDLSNRGDLARFRIRPFPKWAGPGGALRVCVARGNLPQSASHRRSPKDPLLDIECAK